MRGAKCYAEALYTAHQATMFYPVPEGTRVKWYTQNDMDLTVKKVSYIETGEAIFKYAVIEVNRSC